MSFPQYVVRDQLCTGTINQLETHQTLVLRFFRLIDPRIPWTAHDTETDETFIDDVYKFLVDVEFMDVCHQEDLEEIWSYVFESLKRARNGREVYPRFAQLRPWARKHRAVHRNPRDSEFDPQSPRGNRTKRGRQS